MRVMKSWTSATAVSVACGLYAAPTGLSAAQEIQYGARPVQIVYCSDVRCSAEDDEPSIQLESRYPAHAGAILRVVVVSEHDKRSALIDMLSCRLGHTNSGVVSRIAGDAIGADGFIANMATEAFLDCLSRPSLEASCVAVSVLPRQRVRETRAALEPIAAARGQRLRDGLALLRP